MSRDKILKKLSQPFTKKYLLDLVVTTYNTWVILPPLPGARAVTIHHIHQLQERNQKSICSTEAAMLVGEEEQGDGGKPDLEMDKEVGFCPGLTLDHYAFT